MLNISSLPWLALGGLFQLFGFGRWTVPAAAWLAPLFLLRFVRLEPTLVGILLAWLALFISLSIASRGVIPVPGAAYLGVTAAMAASTTLPFLADALLAPRLEGFTSTLIFPLAWVVMEYLSARTNPFGTWGSLASTQSGNLPLMQLASVTGLWGINFLIAWFSSTFNWAWEHNFQWQAVQGGVLLYAIVWSLVMLGGGLRLVLAPSKTPTVRVAAIGWPEDILSMGDVMGVLQPNPSGEEITRTRASFQRLHDWFLESTRGEARAGAKIVLWPEGNLMVFAADEAAFLERARGLAWEHGIYLLMGMGTLHPNQQRFLENKAVLIDPAGEVAFSYTKSKPVPGWEAMASIRGDGRLRTSESPYGRLAAAICYDMDFPELLRQAGKAGADLLLVPASDWEAIKELHHEIAVFRAVENGVSMVRVTRWGLSGVVDALGRPLAHMDHFAADPRVMVAQVPITGLRTIYAVIGDAFAWACLAGLVTLAGVAII